MPDEGNLQERATYFSKLEQVREKNRLSGCRAFQAKNSKSAGALSRLRFCVDGVE